MVTSSAASAAARFPGAVGVIAVIADDQYARLRQFSSGRSTRMKNAADTVRTRLSLAVSNSKVSKLLGVPLANARPGTTGRTIHGTVRYSMTDAPARNVVAILKGSDAKLRGEYVAMGAHNDHLGNPARRIARSRFTQDLERDCRANSCRAHWSGNRVSGVRAYCRGASLHQGKRRQSSTASSRSSRFDLQRRRR
jgi:hypothetical protein